MDVGNGGLEPFRQFLRQLAHESHRQIAGLVRYIFDTVSDSAYTGDPTQTEYMAGLTRLSYVRSLEDALGDDITHLVNRRIALAAKYEAVELWFDDDA
jgi:hypothetical protein